MISFDQMVSYSKVIRFWRRVDVRGPDECWNFKGSVKNGYGWYVAKLVGKEYRPHRIAFELTFGQPSKPFICHHCDNPSCCNPFHLFPGTYQDNFNDMVSKGRQGFKTLIKINDDISGLGVSRKTKYELRMRRLGKCRKCGREPQHGFTLCEMHLMKERERMKKRTIAKKSQVLGGDK